MIFDNECYIISGISKDEDSKYSKLEVVSSNGIIECENLIHFPGRVGLNVKSAQKKGKSIELLVKGISYKDLKKGGILSKDNNSFPEVDRSQFYSSKKQFKKGRATITNISGLKLKRTFEVSYNWDSYRIDITSDKKIPIFLSTEYILEVDGEIVKIYPFLVGEIDAPKYDFVKKALSDWNIANRKKITENIIALNIAINHYSHFSEEWDSLKITGKRIGRFILKDSLYKQSVKKILKQSAATGGRSLNELLSVLKLKDEPAKELLHYLANKKLIKIVNDWVVKLSDNPKLSLSPFAASILKRVEEDGTEGTSLYNYKAPAEKEQIFAMERMGILKIYENYVISTELYATWSNKIVELLRNSDKMALNEIKEKTNLSRAALIAILYWMEDEKIISNNDNIRTLC